MSRGPTETKSRILLSARNLFSNHGFTATSLDDILDATGITKGAFYHYFHSKDQLCQQVLEEVITEYKALQKTIDTHLSPEEQLKQWLALLIQKNQSGQWVHSRLITRLSVQNQQLGPELQEQLTRFWQWYEGVCENWLTQHGQDSNEAKCSADILLCTLFGVIWLEKNLGPGLSCPEVMERQLQLILNPT